MFKIMGLCLRLPEASLCGDRAPDRLIIIIIIITIISII